MLAHLSRCGSGPRTAPRLASARLRRATAVLAAVTCGLLAWSAAVPAAFATPRPLPPRGIPEPWPGANLPPAHIPPAIHTITRTIVTGGMAGWQITLIALGAALTAAAAVVLIYRTRATAAGRQILRAPQNAASANRYGCIAFPSEPGCLG